MINQHFRKRFSRASITACCMTKVLGIAVAIKWVSSLSQGLRSHCGTLYSPNGKCLVKVKQLQICQDMIVCS